MDQAENYNFSYTLQNKPILDSNKQMVHVNLVFVYGPNVASDRGKESTTRLTKVKYYNYDRDYDVFRECVKTAFRSGLIAMIKTGCHVAILARISGGIYSGTGRTNKRINSEYETIINEILQEQYQGHFIHRYFQSVILSI